MEENVAFNLIQTSLPSADAAVCYAHFAMYLFWGAL